MVEVVPDMMVAEVVRNDCKWSEMVRYHVQDGYALCLGRWKIVYGHYDKQASYCQGTGDKHVRLGSKR
jgi:hypothetical protein